MHEFWAFALVGFFAQLVDGALGMGFGVISASVLLAQGVPPALASASVNAAKLPTTGTAALSHYLHKNLDWKIVRALSIYGGLGGILGALLLTSVMVGALGVTIGHVASTVAQPAPSFTATSFEAPSGHHAIRIFRARTEFDI